MPKSLKNTTDPKPKSKPETVTVELKSKVYSYPCALCGKSSVAWDITGEAIDLNTGWVAIPLKHAVCGQEIKLDVKLEELK